MSKIKRVVLINPKTRQIEKVYDNAKEVSNDLNIELRHIYRYLRIECNQRTKYLLKYEEDTSEENIEIWCDVVHYALDGTKKCSKCKEWFSIEDMYRCICKLCVRQLNGEYRSTFDGCLRGLALSMKSSALQRKNKGHISKGICELTYPDVLNIYNNQQGKCYYSGIKMETKPLSNWKVSCERLDESEGYTINNTKLICLEFNLGNTQWTLNKISKIKSLRRIKVNMIELSKLISTARKKVTDKVIPLAIKIIIKDRVVYYQCIICLSYLTKDRYIYRNRSHNHCINCQKLHDKEYGNSLRGFMKTMLSSAKQNSLNKSNKRSDECKICTLTFDDLLDKIIEQKGRCYYSDIPLIFKTNSDWRCSLERLNNKLGYTKENTVLICSEFNSGDHSVMSKDENIGSAQWSKDKFNYLLEHLD